MKAIIKRRTVHSKAKTLFIIPVDGGINYAEADIFFSYPRQKKEKMIIIGFRNDDKVILALVLLPVNGNHKFNASDEGFVDYVEENFRDPLITYTELTIESETDFTFELKVTEAKKK